MSRPHIQAGAGAGAGAGSSAVGGRDRGNRGRGARGARSRGKNNRRDNRSNHSSGNANGRGTGGAGTRSAPRQHARASLLDQFDPTESMPVNLAELSVILEGHERYLQVAGWARSTSATQAYASVADIKGALKGFLTTSAYTELGAVLVQAAAVSTEPPTPFPHADGLVQALPAPEFIDVLTGLRGDSPHWSPPKVKVFNKDAFLIASLRVTQSGIPNLLMHYPPGESTPVVAINRDLYVDRSPPNTLVCLAVAVFLDPEDEGPAHVVLSETLVKKRDGLDWIYRSQLNPESVVRVGPPASKTPKVELNSQNDDLIQFVLSGGRLRDYGRVHRYEDDDAEIRFPGIRVGDGVVVSRAVPFSTSVRPVQWAEVPRTVDQSYGSFKTTHRTDEVYVCVGCGAPFSVGLHNLAVCVGLKEDALRVEPNSSLGSIFAHMRLNYRFGTKDAPYHPSDIELLNLALVLFNSPNRFDASIWAGRFTEQFDIRDVLHEGLCRSCLTEWSSDGQRVLTFGRDPSNWPLDFMTSRSVLVPPHIVRRLDINRAMTMNTSLDDLYSEPLTSKYALSRMAVRAQPGQGGRSARDENILTRHVKSRIAPTDLEEEALKTMSFAGSVDSSTLIGFVKLEGVATFKVIATPAATAQQLPRDKVMEAASQGLYYGILGIGRVPVLPRLAWLKTAPVTITAYALHTDDVKFGCRYCHGPLPHLNCHGVLEWTEAPEREIDGEMVTYLPYDTFHPRAFASPIFHTPDLHPEICVPLAMLPVPQWRRVKYSDRESLARLCLLGIARRISGKLSGFSVCPEANVLGITIATSYVEGAQILDRTFTVEGEALKRRDPTDPGTPLYMYCPECDAYHSRLDDSPSNGVIWLPISGLRASRRPVRKGDTIAELYDSDKKELVPFALVRPQAEGVYLDRMFIPVDASRARRSDYHFRQCPNCKVHHHEMLCPMRVFTSALHAYDHESHPYRDFVIEE